MNRSMLKRHEKKMVSGYILGIFDIHFDSFRYTPSSGRLNMFEPCKTQHLGWWKHVIDSRLTSLTWLVVWNMFYFPIYLESSSHLTFIFFRGVGIPPASKHCHFELRVPVCGASGNWSWWCTATRYWRRFRAGFRSGTEFGSCGEKLSETHDAAMEGDQSDPAINDHPQHECPYSGHNGHI